MNSAETVVRVCVTVHDNDNVATLLDHHAEVTRLANGAEIDAGIGFGHKFALQAIPAGGAVIKYGVVIGKATQAIREGEHVHVHNVR